MTDSPIQQFFSQLKRVKKILIAVPPKPNADLAGAASALTWFLTKLDKEVEVLCEDDFEAEFPYLSESGKLKKTLSSSQSLAVVVDTSQKALEEISYQQEAGRIRIFLKSRGEIFSPEEISFEAQKAPFDLVIILGAETLEDLGLVFESNVDVFFETPKVNIDNSAGNKYFGSINLIDINSASLSEIVTGIFKEFETDLLDEDIATALLSGIIAKTHSFQHPQVSPKSFLQASELVALGARQQEIVKALFKTKPLPLLKLWGRSLARLKDLGEAAMAPLTASDLAKAGAEVNLLPMVLKELLENLNSKIIVGVLAEVPPGIKAFLAVRLGTDWQSALKDFGPVKAYKNFLPSSFAALEFDLPASNLQQAEQKFEQAAQKLISPGVS